MDKQKRLTRWAEWKIGRRYQWLKGGVYGHILECTGICKKGGYIILGDLKRLSNYRNFNWRNRFVKL